ncbi:Coenzyme F420 biosynthesis-associated protein OS=Streptomyces fumanus OX=67302 GN=GCM10018772_09150 PE=4 SV=1 [Streptomyces fumanus]
MDGVGPGVVPAVGEVRERLQRRRAQGASRLVVALRQLVGLDAKLGQCRDGERLVRAVVDVVGMDGVNRVWTSRKALNQGGDRRAGGLGRTGVRRTEC